MKIRTSINAQNSERRPVANFRAGPSPEHVEGATPITGYAALFNSLSQVLYDWSGGFREQIAPGAFARSLAEDDPRMLWNHNPDYPLARVAAGNLQLREDDTGLWFHSTPVATTIAGDVALLIASGVVSGMSFGFTVLDEEWDIDDQNQVIRTLLRVKLYEISPVTWPAYTDTSVSLASSPRPLADILGDQPTLPPGLRSHRRKLALQRRYLDLLAVYNPT